jgi:hypothetical protein
MLLGLRYRLWSASQFRDHLSIISEVLLGHEDIKVVVPPSFRNEEWIMENLVYAEHYPEIKRLVALLRHMVTL